MRLSWNEVRVRAATFAEKWQDAAYETEETQSFYNDFFQVFGVERRSVARYEQHVRKLDNRSGFIDLFWPGVLIVEQKSVGRDLSEAYGQAGEYFDALPEHERPRYILVSDFQTFELHDLDEREKISFPLKELPSHVEAFGFILGIQRRVFRDQDPANIEASELVGQLHDRMKDAGYRGHDLERFLARIVFCLFADDTGIFEPRDIFLDLIESRTNKDGSDTGSRLTELFQILDTPESDRQKTLDEDLARFPYVNGDLFDGVLRIPSFDGIMREALLDACRFDWSNISPAIFGALFQSVMDPEARHADGAHYTTEGNILKVIEPLFLDDLRSEFKRLKSRKDRRRHPELMKFQKKLGEMRFFDPACGCGNFLIIAYRELRILEIEVMKEIYPSGQLDALAGDLSVIDVDQFYGIEINEFPVRVAETALWMMDHIMNNRLSLEFGQTYVRIPLKKSPHIHHGDALEVDWAEFCPPQQCSHMFGNPPYLGAKVQTPEQRMQVRHIAALGGTGGSLDYVSAWFIKAGEYVQKSSARIGFVATNSITQGEQVGQLWPILFDRCKLEIAFAHRTFAWGSDARGKAHVHVVIIGLDRRENARANTRLFNYPDINDQPEETRQAVLSPYLFDASGLPNPYLVVREESSPINGMPRLKTGVQMIDNGILTFEESEKEEFLAIEPEAAPFFRCYIGGDEFINGFHRWILYLRGINPTELKRLPQVAERVAQVRAYRAASRRPSTRRMADFPTLVGVDERLDADHLVIPNTSSERRAYIPIGWLGPSVIANQKLRILPNASLTDFALLTSAMHMAWMRTVTGRMKSDYMYSVGVVYNTFPLPSQEADLSKLEPLAQAILDARAEHLDATLADLYDPDLMPPNLLRAHQALDRAVDKLYRRKGFGSKRERIEHLFMLYEQAQAPLEAQTKARPKRRQTGSKLKR
ncbi:MAG: class I SAM-dependent DNA methyltransferase [Gammaproteobacteria bacterium]|nr:class I SAM-dependent DNA methyltransferase [Gammaproteobacteria bacterium]